MGRPYLRIDRYSAKKTEFAQNLCVCVGRHKQWAKRKLISINGKNFTVFENQHTFGSLSDPIPIIAPFLRLWLMILMLLKVLVLLMLLMLRLSYDKVSANTASSGKPKDDDWKQDNAGENTLHGLYCTPYWDDRYNKCIFPSVSRVAYFTNQSAI